MNYKAMVIVGVLAACGGSAPVDQTPDSGTPPPAGTTMLQAGTYKPGAATTALTAAPAGPAMDTTMITDWSGSFSMVLPNYDFVRGVMAVYPDGALKAACGGSGIGGGCVLVHQDGGVEPAVIVGTSVGGTITATVNGTVPFSVALTTIQDQDFKVSQMAGNYISTSSNTGQWVAVNFDAGGSIQGYAYATQADAEQPLDQTGSGGGALGLPWQHPKAVGYYPQGSIRHTTVPTGPCTTGPLALPCVAPPNSFDIGFCYEDLPAIGGARTCTGGSAYFTANRLVALTVNPNTGEQLTAVFSKQP